MDDGVARARLEGEPADRFVRLRQELGVSSFGINQIVLRPGERGRIHCHRHQEEVYLVLAGTLTVLVEGEPHELAEGELLRVAPDLRRQLVNRGPGTVSLLGLGGHGEHAGRDGEAFASWEESTGSPPSEVPLPPNLDASELRT